MREVEAQLQPSSPRGPVSVQRPERTLGKAAAARGWGGVAGVAAEVVHRG